MKKQVIRLLAVLWLAALLRLTVFRDGCFSHGLFSGRMEWDAFAYYAKLARVGNWRYFTYLFVGNLVWFVPVGVLAWLREAGSAGRETRTLRKHADGKVPSLQAGAARNADGRVPSLQAGAARNADGRVPSLQAGADRKADKQCLSLRALLRAALFGFLLSLGIETMQYILGSGVSELDDLILNTAGAVLGWGFAWITHQLNKKVKFPIALKSKI